MKTTTKLLSAAAAIALPAASAVQAQESSRLSWEMEIEIGVEHVLSSDDPTAEITDAFLSNEIVVSYEFSDTVTGVVEFTLESVTDPTDDRAFEDLGLYVSELNLVFDLGSAELTVGKISPAFGIAWDAAPGFFGANFAEDYELGESLGASLAFELGAGNLTLAAFYQDDTVLSRSIGTDRGRTRESDGGVGNTGTLNNFSIQYDFEVGNTEISASAMHLAAGVGDTDDQNGAALGFVHNFNDQVEVVGEVAYFDGFGGTTDNANYVTLGASYFSGPFTYTASVTRRDVSSSGTDYIASLGLDYTFDNDITLSSGLVHVEEGGVNSTGLGLSVIIPLGNT